MSFYDSKEAEALVDGDGDGEEEEPFVAPVEFGHEDFVHDWSLTPHAAV